MIGKFGISGQLEVGVHGQVEARRGVAQIDEAVLGDRPAVDNVQEDFDRNHR